MAEKAAPHLLERDIQMFAKIRVSLPEIAKCQIIRVTDDSARIDYGIGINRKGDMAGILFPYISPDTGRLYYCRVRRDRPEIEKGKFRNKYLSPDGNTRAHPYFFPGSTARIKDFEIPAVIVEAEKSAIALMAWSDRVGFPLLPIGIGGCWGFRSSSIGKVDLPDGHQTNESGVLPDLVSVCTGRQVYVLLDSNAASNPKVKAARKSLVRELQEARAKVFALDLPVLDGVNGPDDYIGIAGDDAMRKVFETRPNGSAARVEEEEVTIEPDLTRIDMPETVLDGRLGEICLSRMKNFPLAYSWITLLTVAGVSPLLKQTTAITRGIKGNLFSCLVGDVHSGKSSALDYALHVLGIQELDPVVLEGAKYGSAEGLANDIQKLAIPVCLLAPDELSHLLRKCAIENASFPGFLNSAFYKDRQRGATKTESWEIDCRISIIGGLVEDYFEKSFGHDSVTGLYDRFLFGLCPRPYTFHYYPPYGGPEAISLFPPDVDESVFHARDAWIAEGINSRVAEIGLRVAWICGAVDRRGVLRESDLGPAHAFVEYQMKVRKYLRPNPGENPDAQCAVSVLKFLQEKAASGGWIKRRDVARAAHCERVGPVVFNRVLNNLQFNDQIELDPKLKRVRLLPDA